jgi:hypothetical protein
MLLSPRIGLKNRLGFAPQADDGFVNAHSDLSQGNASVDGLKTGWGGGTARSFVVTLSTQFAAGQRRRRGARCRAAACTRVIGLTLCPRTSAGHCRRGPG